MRVLGVAMVRVLVTHKIKSVVARMESVLAMSNLDTKESNGLKITVDKDLCIGAGSCELLAPDVFGIDKENKAYIKDGWENTDEETIKQAAMSCPVLAIIVEKNEQKVWPE